MNKKVLRNCIILGMLLVFGVFFTVQSQDDTPPHITILAEGLYNPVGMALLPNGNLLIAEEGTGNDDLSAGVSMMLPDGTIGRLISGFPSARDAGDLSGVPLVNVSPDGETIYIGSFNAGHLWTLASNQAETLPETPFTPDDLGVAVDRLNNVFLINPFDMTFDVDGVPIVVDATGNGVATEQANGTVRFFHRFDLLSDPLNDTEMIQAVPTGITRVDDDYYVALLGGCPYPANSGEIVVIDENRNQETVIDNLNLPIDVALGQDNRLWVLEFATFSPDGSCFTGTGYRPETGRLSYYENDMLVPVLDNLDFPGSVLPLADGSLYLTEIFNGRIVHISFDEPETAQNNEMPEIVIAEPEYVRIDDVDLALASVIDEQGLEPNIGQDFIQADEALVELGQDLFFDPILSGDMNISCATCHHPELAMGDARVLPLGTGGAGLGEARSYMQTINIMDDYAGDVHGEVPNPLIGELVPRNSPSIINTALLPVQFWDGRVQSYALGQLVTTLEDEVNVLGLTDALAVQAFFPVTSVAEMAGTTFGDELPHVIRDRISHRLMANPDYYARFSDIFAIDTIEPVHIATALAAFEQEFIFTESAWDDYIAGDINALTDEQKRGALLFFGELNPSVNCASCHSGNLFTDMQFYNLLVPQIGSGKHNGVTGREDFGRANVTFDYRDQYTFRTPTLRNISLTAPYFHSGAYASLDDVIWHHANIIEGASQYDPATYLPSAYYSSVLPFNWERQGHSASPELMNGLPLSEQDVADLVDFLQALTDPNALDLSEFTPESVPSGLELDPLPTASPMNTSASSSRENTASDTENIAETSWHFEDVAQSVGIDFEHNAFETDIFADPVAMMGGGVCWIDYDKDGWLDIYWVNSYAEDEVDYWLENGGLPQNTLYRNANGVFVDVSEETQTNLSMRGNGCIVADFNNDGWNDIFITADGDNALLLNNDTHQFEEVGELAGLNAPEWNSASAVADLNNDGWLDLFVGSYLDFDNPIPNPIGAFPQDYYGIPDHLYLNNGLNAEGVPTFTDITRELGLHIDERTLGAIFSDLDHDNDLDLYIANDGQPNRLYLNEASDNEYGFTFVDTYDTSGVNDRGSGMGVTSGDWTGDSRFDLMVTNWDRELNAIYRNNIDETGYPNFIYSTYRIGMVGLGNNMTGWGVHFADLDHDTDLDLLTVNGRVPVVNFETDAELIRLYGNRLVEGYEGQFREWTQLVGLDDIGTRMARGSALADFDNDGDLDLAINSIGGSATLLQNQEPSGNWLMVDFDESLAGTRLTATLADGTILEREVHIGSSYLASEDPRVHFGLGENTVIQSLLIRYVTGETLLLETISANQMLRIQELSD